MGSLDSHGFNINPSVINVWNTVKEVVGAGYLTVIGMYCSAAFMPGIHLKVEIDGDVPNDNDFVLLATVFNSDYAGGSRKQATFPLELRFETGFKVTIMDDVGGHDLYCGVFWTIDQ